MCSLLVSGCLITLTMVALIDILVVPYLQCYATGCHNQFGNVCCSNAFMVCSLHCRHIVAAFLMTLECCVHYMHGPCHGIVLAYWYR